MIVSSFIIVEYVWQVLESGAFLSPFPHPWAAQKSPSGIGLKRTHFWPKVNKLANLLTTINFSLALKQVFAIWLSNLSLLSIVTPKSLSSLLSQILSLPIFAERFQVFHYRQKGSCYQQNYKCLFLVKKKRSFKKILKSRGPTIIFIIFWDFLTFYQIFLLPQVRYAIITYKHGIYELLHELPNDLRLRIIVN